MYRGLNPKGAVTGKGEYTALWRKLDDAGISFISIATYLQANLEERYEIEGAPDIGAFATDLEGFLKTSLSLKQRARKLKDLEARWIQTNTEDEE